MDNKDISSLLKWGILNSDTGNENPASKSGDRASRDISRGLNPRALSNLFGGLSDVDKARGAMATIEASDEVLASILKSSEEDLEGKEESAEEVLAGKEESAEQAAAKKKEKLLVMRADAFEKLREFLEIIDNANSMDHLGLWAPLLDQLDNNEPRLRAWAASCVAAAVQNNLKTQKRALDLGLVPKFVSMAFNDKDASVRKAAVHALSSEVRPYQTAMNAMLDELPPERGGKAIVDASKMEEVDSIIVPLREYVTKEDYALTETEKANGSG